MMLCDCVKKFFIVLMVSFILCVSVVGVRSMTTNKQRDFSKSAYDVQVVSYARDCQKKVCINISSQDGTNVYELGCFVRQQFEGSVVGFSDDMCFAMVYTGVDFSQADEVKNKIEKFLK